MEHYAFLFVNTALVVGCTAMAFVFLILPLPANKGLHKYRISLRFLASAYLVMALIKLVIMVFDVAMVNLISIEVLLIGTLQATLFTSTLIALIDLPFITRHYLYTQLMPVLILIILYVLAVYRWGNPQILNFAGLKLLASHPTVLIREVFLFYYVFQLVYLTRLFSHQARKYEDEVDNYSADSLRLRLPGVRYSFYAALTVGICALLSCFMFSALWVLIFTIAYAIFYLVFGIYYIQYPRTYVDIEQAIYPPRLPAEDLVKSYKRLVWDELKNQIIADKYYLRAGVNIEEMAQYLKIGRTTLSTFINNEEGINFNMWINSLRIEEAKCLLLEYPSYNLAQIAEMIGYSESSNFSRQFKLITNESPSVWRQSSQSYSDL